MGRTAPLASRLQGWGPLHSNAPDMNTEKISIAEVAAEHCCRTLQHPAAVAEISCKDQLQRSVAEIFTGNYCKDQLHRSGPCSDVMLRIT